MGRRTAVPFRAAALAWVLALACDRGGGGAKPGAPEQATVTLAPDNVARVEVRTLASGPGLSGTLRARREAALRAEVGGAVLEVAAEAGERVRAGQLLCRIDDSTLRQQLSAARSAVAAAKQAFQLAEANARRARTLAEAGAMAPQQAEQAESALEAARAQLSEADTRAALAAEQAGKARVRAPFAGVVAQRQVSVGDVVAPGAALFTVIDPGRLQLEASVPAARLGEARPGARVDFSVTGFGEERFAGEIERVAPAVDAATGQVRVFVDVPNEGGRLISGLYAEGRVASRRASAPAAPEEAVDLSTTPPTVLRVTEGRVERVAVEVGIRDDAAGLVAITSGVRPGDVLVLGSARATLAEGAPVRIAQEAGAGAEADAEADPGAPAGTAPRGEEKRAARRPPEDR